jgi:transcriptional regulator with XRE-family HTH domain
MSEVGPAASRVLLGRELKELREAAGLDQPHVAEMIGWHAPKVYRSETGVGGLKAGEIDQLLELYGASEEAAERVRAVGAQARRRGSYGKVPDWARQYVGLEQDATALAFHQGELVPGLFQTESYARALVATSVVVSKVDVDTIVAGRMRRREILNRRNPARVSLVLGEAALHRQVGGSDALREQLEYLIEVAALPQVTLQVLPFSVGAHAAVGNGFVLLTLDIGASEAQWVYLDDLMRGECRADSAQVRAYQMTYDSLQVNALGEGATITLIKDALKGLR